MFRFKASREIPRSASEIWAVLIDFPRIPSWERGPIEVRQTSPGPPGVGATIMARRLFGGREATLHGEISDWRDGRSATMSLVGGPLARSYVTYSVEPRGQSRSVVTFSAEGSLAGPMRPFTPLVGLVGRSVARNNLRRLEELLNQQAG